MTEEKIDGADVSGCEYCIDNACYFEYCIESVCNFTKHFGVSCSEKPNCSYKRLKRLETENAKLKEALERIKEVLSFCYSEEGTEIPCIDCKYYKECGIQPVDYVIKIASEVLEDE